MGAARRLRSLLRDITVCSRFFKTISKSVHRNRPLLHLAEQFTRRDIQIGTWAQQLEWESHCSWVFHSQYFATVLWCYCKVDQEQARIQADNQRAQFREHWISAHHSVKMALQPQMILHCAHQTISQMYLTHPSVAQQQHHKPSWGRQKSLHTPRAILSFRAHMMFLHEESHQQWRQTSANQSHYHWRSHAANFGRPHKILCAGNWWLNESVFEGNSIRFCAEFSQILKWFPQKQSC